MNSIPSYSRSGLTLNTGKCLAKVFCRIFQESFRHIKALGLRLTQADVYIPVCLDVGCCTLFIYSIAPVEYHLLNKSSI